MRGARYARLLSHAFYILLFFLFLERCTLEAASKGSLKLWAAGVRMPERPSEGASAHFREDRICH